MSTKVELELNLKGGNKAVKTLGQLEKELEDAREAIKEVEVGSDAFNKLASKIQNASSEVKTLEKQMEGLEPQQKAEAFLKMGEGIAGGFAVAQGAMALAGIESEELEKLQTKVQSAIAIAQGVRMMSEAALMATTAKRIIVEKLAIAQSKIGIVVTKGKAIALGIATTAQGLFTGAVSLTTVALKALKIAIAATGIGALVLALIAIGKAVYDWATATDEVTQAQANLNRELAEQNSEFLKNRKLQQEISAANTEAEKELARLNARLQDNIDGLAENSTELEENADKLENLSDYSNESQRTIQNNTITLQKNSETLKNNINILDQKIKKVQEEIDAERKREEDEQERANRRRQRRSERKAQREREAEQLRALQEENKRMAIERIGDDETRELALLDFEKDLQLEKIKDANNFEEQRLLIEKKYAQKRADVQAKYVDETVDGLAKINKKGEDLQEELYQKTLQRRQEEKERIEQIEANRQEFRETAHNQVIEQLQAHMGARMSELDKQMNKEIALAEAQGKSTEGIEQKFAQKKTQLEKKQKKVAVAQAIIATFESANQSYKAMSGIPFVGPGLGIAAAALAVSAGTANVRQILAQDVGGGAGGSAGVGGGSGFNATEPMVPATTGAFTLGNVEQPAVKAFVVESEITDSQAQMADINRRSTI